MLTSAFQLALKAYASETGVLVKVSARLACLSSPVHIAERADAPVCGRAQEPCSTTITEWFKLDFGTGTPEHTAIHPHKSDYCAICQSLQLDMSSIDKSLARHKQQGDGRIITGESGVAELNQQLAELKEELAEHKRDAAAAMGDYKRRAVDARPHYAAVAQDFAAYCSASALLPISTEPDGYDSLIDRIANLQFQMSTDYQQDKFMPYWGSSPQPGPTYFMSHLTLYVHIICAESLGEASGPSRFGRNRIYTREQTEGGSKDGNDTLSTIFDFLLDDPASGLRLERLRPGWSEDGVYSPPPVTDADSAPVTGQASSGVADSAV